MRLLAHNNKRTMCPPGALPSSAGRAPIVVASLMRSGTHLVIDTLFNNFPDYRGTPLYIDLDEWVRSGGSLADLSSVEGVVIKTHYPQVEVEVMGEGMDDFFKKAHIIVPTRDKDEVFASAAKDSFGYYSEREKFEEDASRFHSFWSNYECLEVSFKDIVNREVFPSIVTRIANRCQMSEPKKIVFPFRKVERKRVYFWKAWTRFFGRLSPVINTTIGFAKKK